MACPRAPLRNRSCRTCRSSVEARCATSTPSTTASSSSPPIASRRSTTCLGSGIPDKGRVLTQLSRFWFDRTQHIVENHLISADAGEFPAGLAPVSRRARGTGDAGARRPRRCRSSAWRAATCRARAGRITRRPARCAASRCPSGLVESDRLPEPIFTPATKAESGHDLNISFDEAAAPSSARSCSSGSNA